MECQSPDCRKPAIHFWLTHAAAHWLKRRGEGVFLALFLARGGLRCFCDHHLPMVDDARGRSRHPFIVRSQKVTPDEAEVFVRELLVAEVQDS
jgi:hypothetical protein